MSQLNAIKKIPQKIPILSRSRTLAVSQARNSIYLVIVCRIFELANNLYVTVKEPGSGEEAVRAVAYRRPQRPVQGSRE